MDTIVPAPVIGLLAKRTLFQSPFVTRSLAGDLIWQSIAFKPASKMQSASNVLEALLGKAVDFSVAF
jgi:hypothetical protein